jgi:hypothetical protein
MRGLANRVGRRGAALMFFFLLDVVYCFALLDAPRPLVPFYEYMNNALPIGVWAAAWGFVGLVCLFYAFRDQDTPAFICAVIIKVAWGLLALFGWLGGAVDRGYVSAVIWLGFAAFVYLVAGGIPPAVGRPKPGRWALWIRS